MSRILFCLCHEVETVIILIYTQEHTDLERLGDFLKATQLVCGNLDGFKLREPDVKSPLSAKIRTSPEGLYLARGQWAFQDSVFSSAEWL